MTTIYFVRHAEPNYENHDDRSRELTQKGMADSERVARFLADKGVQVAVSSPYRRAVDTIRRFAEASGLEILLEEDFREREAGGWIEDFKSFDAFRARQWADFDYRLPGGESLREVQSRNVEALKRLLGEHGGKTIVVATHGIALSMMINHYDARFGFTEFERIKNIMPWIVRMTFEGDVLTGIEELPLP